ncbi:MAG: class I SAM-dependent methyltransferase [Candidatus Omnitrophica bacterium]|nr:class I SAM-dependent methyltransferase [Candidatus Omnitrophota bacterium]
MSKIPGKEDRYYQELKAFIHGNEAECWKKVFNFPKYVDRIHLAKFMARYELFRKILNVHGSIVECGVWNARGTMSFAQWCSIFEPYNHTRKVIGFDTFPVDKSKKTKKKHKLGESGLTQDSFEEISKAIELFDSNRPIGHIPKVELVKGDAVKTIPIYIKDNRHLIVSMLYLDFGAVEPTRVALDNFLTRVPKGGIIAFDNIGSWKLTDNVPSLAKKLGIPSLKLQKFDFEPAISYAVVE